MAVNIHEAKTHFSKLIERVRAGEEIVIAKAGRPVAKLVPIEPKPKRRFPGSAKDKIWMAPDFDDYDAGTREALRVKVLLDTPVFLWWVMEDERLSGRARRLIGSGGNDVFLSAVSAWEIVAKAATGRLRLPESPERFIPSQLQENAFGVLPVQLAHALKVWDLPQVHRDPFDRLLVAQALAEELALVSGDPVLRRYPVKVVW